MNLFKKILTGEVSLRRTIFCEILNRFKFLRYLHFIFERQGASGMNGLVSYPPNRGRCA